MNKILKYFAPLVFVLSLLSLIFFKSIPVSKLWSEYTVLYVPASENDYDIIQSLHDFGIKDEVSLSGQFLPINIPENSVEISMFRLNRDNPKFSYYLDRNAFFYDKSSNYRLYYIPEIYKNNLYDCVNYLNKKNIMAGVDSTTSYPWILPVIITVLVVILALFAKKRFLFIISSLITVIYIYSNPFYNCGVSCIIIILFIFFVSNLWNRKGSVNLILQHFFIPAGVLISIICTFSTSFRAGLFFVIALISISSFMFIYKCAEEFITNRGVFVPVYILPAKKVSLFAKKSNLVMIICLTVGLIITSLYILTSSKTFNSHFSKLQLPSVSETADTQLPQLEDYYQWLWNIKAYPYQTLNNQANNDYLIEFPHYKDENGFISESMELKSYNQNFKINSFAEIDNLQFNSIEKVIKSEGENVSLGYNSTSTNNASLLSLIMMIICFFILLFIYIYTIIKKEV